MIETLVALTKERWPDLYPEMYRPDTFNYALQSRKRVILFLFERVNGKNRLVAVIKVGRMPKENAAMERSVEWMQTIRSRLTGSLQYTIPKTFILGQVNGLTCVVEEALSGEPIEISTSRWRLRTETTKNIRAFADWLVVFQDQAHTGQRCLDDLAVSKTLTSLKTQLNGSPIPEKAIALFAHFEQNTPSLELPLSWRYGDAHHSNILLNDGQVSGVIDWTGAKPDQFPIFDWFQFVFEYARSYSQNLQLSKQERGDTLFVLKMLLDVPSDPVSTILQAETVRFLTAYNLPTNLFPVLFLIFLDQFWWPYDKPTLIRQALSLLEKDWPKS